MYVILSQTDRKRRGSSGFSLLEMIVVITVIVVLFALMFPLVKNVYAERENTQCMAYMRNAMIAIHSWVADSGGVFKTWARGDNSTGVGIWGWNLLRLGYIDNGALLRCPSGDSQFPLDNGAWYRNTYGVNMLDANGVPVSAAGGAQDYTLYLSQVVAPSQHIFLVDSATLAFIPDKPGKRSQTFRANMNRLTDGIHLRHSRRANVVFLDGHMESLNRERARDFFKDELIYEEDH